MSTSGLCPSVISSSQTWTQPSLNMMRGRARQVGICSQRRTPPMAQKGERNRLSTLTSDAFGVRTFVFPKTYAWCIFFAQFTRPYSSHTVTAQLSLCCVVCSEEATAVAISTFGTHHRMTRSQGLAMRQATAVLTTSGTPNSARIPPAILELDPRISCVSFRLP